MKRIILIALLASLHLPMFGAEKGGITLVGVEISAQRSERVGGVARAVAAENLDVKEGDIITVVGAQAQDEDVTFRYNGTEWLTDREYQFRDDISEDSPFYIYYGKDAYIEDGDQMADILVSKQTAKPADGRIVLDEFEHACAQVRVEIMNWERPQPPVVTLKNIHKVEYMNRKGGYILNEQKLYSIVLTEQSHDGTNYTFTALVPAHDDVSTNIQKGYSLMVDDMSIFNYVENDSNVPKSYSGNQRYTFSLDFATPTEHQ